MKKVILICLLMALLTNAHSQVSFSVPIGFSTNKVPTIGANLQLGIGGFILSAGLDAQMSRKVKNGDLYYVRTGASFNLSISNKVELTAGMGSYRRSSDVKSLNEGIALVNVQYIHRLDERNDGSLFAGITTTSKFSFVSGGLRFTFRKRERNGCPSTWVR
jgi:hypothetical protein